MSIVTIPDGLPGFEQCRQFQLVQGAELEPFTCLQSIDEGGPSFLTIEPALVVDQFERRLSKDDQRRIDAQPDDTLLWLAITRVEGDRAFANLRAPVVINPRTMKGLQVLNADSDHSVEHPLWD